MRILRSALVRHLPQLAQYAGDDNDGQDERTGVADGLGNLDAGETEETRQDQQRRPLTAGPGPRGDPGSRGSRGSRPGPATGPPGSAATPARGSQAGPATGRGESGHATGKEKPPGKLAARGGPATWTAV